MREQAVDAHQEQQALERELAERAGVGKTPAKSAGRAAKPAKAAKPGEPADVLSTAHGDLPATFRITHGERVMDKDSGVTKADLVRAYSKTMQQVFRGMRYYDGFSDEANLDKGAMWPTSFALKELTAAEEAKIGALVKRAVS